ncbi:hypothetical protein RUM44_008322 [Polyplax serrata]|uniref:Uncharacterized protein n=1 Tax=Polyplax serrata TaxID=468196 RepID=A0ABR1BCF1_POLSC
MSRKELDKRDNHDLSTLSDKESRQVQRNQPFGWRPLGKMPNQPRPSCGFPNGGEKRVRTRINNHHFGNRTPKKYCNKVFDTDRKEVKSMPKNTESSCGGLPEEQTVAISTT